LQDAALHSAGGQPASTRLPPPRPYEIESLVAGSGQEWAEADRSGQKDVHPGGAHHGFGSDVTISAATPNEFSRWFPEPPAAGSSPAGDASPSLA